MKKIMQFVLGILLCGLVINAAINSKKSGERYLLKGNAPVHISVETGWQRDGLIPVQLDIPGLHLELWMDGEGRVFEDTRLELAMETKSRTVRLELFHLDKSNGQLQAGDKILNGLVYEQNALRTRLRFDNLELALQLDTDKGRAALDLNGISIPVRVRLGKEINNLRELEIGERGYRGEGRLLLDGKQGRLFFETNYARPAADNQQSNNMCWAERQK